MFNPEFENMILESAVMEKELNIKLIEGNFKMEDGNQLLLELLRFKINYHDRRLFSDFVREGEDISNSKHRLEQLNRSLSDLRSFIANAEDAGQHVDIDCTIHIRKS